MVNIKIPTTEHKPSKRQKIYIRYFKAYKKLQKEYNKAEKELHKQLNKELKELNNETK